MNPKASFGNFHRELAAGIIPSAARNWCFTIKKIKLNIGCGLDYRDGFINIDGREDLPRIDKIINISKYSLLDYFAVGSMDYLPANDFIVKLPFRKRSVAEWVS